MPTAAALGLPVSASAAISGAALASARVLCQVDAKFILAALADGTLVAVDQHAADERCLLEELQRQVLGGPDEPPQAPTVGAAEKRPPVRAALTPHERGALAAYLPAVERWGWSLAEVAEAAEEDREPEEGATEAAGGAAGEPRSGSGSGAVHVRNRTPPFSLVPRARRAAKPIPVLPALTSPSASNTTCGSPPALRCWSPPS